jgi:ketosteroid isomerase-like protein
MKNIILVFMVLTIFSVTSAQSIEEMSPKVEPLTIVKEFFQAYIQGDHEKVSSLLHPEIIWIQPGNNRIAGVKGSREEVLLMGKRMIELSDKSISLTDIKFLNTTGNSVACILHWKATHPTGAVLDVDNVDVYTIENGKIVCVKVYSNDLMQEDKFWGR